METRTNSLAIFLVRLLKPIATTYTVKISFEFAQEIPQQD